MALLDLGGFEEVPQSSLTSGFYADAKAKTSSGSKKKILLLRTPKNIKASDLNGLKLELPQSSKGPIRSSSMFSVSSGKSDGRQQVYQLVKGAEGSLAPVALAMPSSSRGIHLKKGFDQVLNLSLAVDVPKAAEPEVDLEDDIGGRGWKKIPQASNLGRPLSVFNIEMHPAAPAPKKRKNN